MGRPPPRLYIDSDLPAFIVLICSAIRMRINALKMRTQNRGSKVKVLKTLHLNHRVQLVIKKKKANGLTFFEGTHGYPGGNID